MPSEALGCQTAIARQSRAHEGDALGAWPQKHRKASKEVPPSWLAPIAPQSAWRTREHVADAFDDTQGRLGRRRLWTRTAWAVLPALAPWPARCTVMRVATMRPAPVDAPTTSHSRCLLASPGRSATVCRPMMRQHWHLAQRRYGSFDGTWHAERCSLRTDHASEHMVAWRPGARHRRRQEQAQPRRVRRQRLRCRLDEYDLLTVISGAT